MPCSRAAMSSTKFAAEIGAAFLCADLGITPETRDDKRAIFTAASHAQKAADYLHGLQPQTGTTEAEDMQEAA